MADWGMLRAVTVLARHEAARHLECLDQILLAVHPPAGIPVEIVLRPRIQGQRESRYWDQSVLGLVQSRLVPETLRGLGWGNPYWDRPGFQTQNQVDLLGCQIDCPDPQLVG